MNSLNDYPEVETPDAIDPHELAELLDVPEHTLTRELEA